MVQGLLLLLKLLLVMIWLYHSGLLLLLLLLLDLLPHKGCQDIGSTRPNQQKGGTDNPFGKELFLEDTVTQITKTYTKGTHEKGCRLFQRRRWW